MAEIELRGCKYEPLISYLKTLGVLRTVSLQKDATARGFWRGNHFVMNLNITQDEMISFFLDEYKPSPVFSPWNKGSGFFPRGRETEAVKIIRSFRSNKEVRLASFRDAILKIEDIIEKVTDKKPKDVDDRVIEKYKLEIMASCRNALPDELLDWLDAVYALTLDDKFDYQPKFAVVLGSGGNDGNLEFSKIYLESIWDVFEKLKRERATVRSMLTESLFAVGDKPAAGEVAVGFFHPGGVGGPNATEGFEGPSLSNPWDFIFMVEGVLLLAGSVNRRMSRESIRSVASFPFTVAAVSGGADVISGAEGAGASSRGELWMPLWKKPLGMKEIKRLFSEGRARLGRKTAADGLDFARAVATFGISRGINGFVRYGIYQRSGRSYLAVPLTVMPVREEKLKGADLLSDIDSWLKQIKSLEKDESIPARANKIPRLVYNCIFDYLQKGDKASFQRLIVYLGKAEMVLSELSDPSADEGVKKIHPLNLSYLWADYANDGTPEFRIAYSLAGIGWTGADLHPIRMDLHQVDIIPEEHGGRRAIRPDKTKKVIPRMTDPIVFLASILEHRCILGKKEEKELAPIGSMSYAFLEDVRKFLSGSLDYRKIADLFLGLILINDPGRLTDHGYAKNGTMDKAYELPRDYILLKACYLTEPVNLEGEKLTIPYDMKVVNLIRARRIGDACIYAARKLKARGIIPIATFGKDGLDPMRLYASLLIPVDVHEFVKKALPLIRKSNL